MMPSAGKPPVPPGPALPPVDPHQTRRATKQAKEEGKKDEFFIVCLKNLTYLFNSSTNKHKEFSPNCDGELNVNKESQKLISVTLFMTCTKCKFVGPNCKMYSDMEYRLEDIVSGNLNKAGRQNSGPRHSTLNVSLALALTASSIGTTQWQEIMGGIGVHAGSTNGMNNLMTAVGPLNEKLANESMTRGIDGLIELQAKGEEVGVSFDVMYNNSKIRNHVPMQPASQAVGTVIGSNKKTIHLTVKNKLCWKCSKSETDNLIKNGKAKPCDSKGCTRNTATAATISDEATTLRSALQALGEKGLKPNYCSLDGDAKNANVLSDNNIELSRDAWHVSKNIDKKYSKLPCDLNDFDGDIVAEKEKEWKDFRGCVLARCNAELKSVSGKVKHLRGAVKKNKMSSMTRYITNTILNCHQGLCGEISKCETRSFVCSGKNSYIKYGPTPTLGAKNTKLVKDMIDERMKGYLDVTFRNSNTSINEARNKAHTKVVPKTLTCSKNAISRLSRGTLVSNEGLAGSSNICNNAIGHRRSKNVINKMATLERKKAYSVRYSATRKHKARAQIRIKHLKDIHKAKRSCARSELYGPGIDMNTC